MNRITPAIAKMQSRIEALTPEKRANLDAGMAVEPFEHAAFQNAQAHALAAGNLTFDEAMVIYRALGEVGSSRNGGWASGTDLATKVIVTQVMGELLAKR